MRYRDGGVVKAWCGEWGRLFGREYHPSASFSCFLSFVVTLYYLSLSHNPAIRLVDASLTLPYLFPMKLLPVSSSSSSSFLRIPFTHHSPIFKPLCHG